MGEIEDNPEELKDRIDSEVDENVYRGVYFTKEGVPYILGVIDPLTGFNF